MFTFFVDLWFKTEQYVFAGLAVKDPLFVDLYERLPWEIAIKEADELVAAEKRLEEQAVLREKGLVDRVYAWLDASESES